ncbi:pectin methylesterase-like acyl-CoA thioesterase [Breznakibacter xylanolyticus]|uniref:Pectin methylesterase-like acyl-CoA thioesterase n=1 Tax=Breznakibacter xylanolyticus TaxID=990 RepID=A0A2W7ND52_9BACT|nr:pectinesterase family protein [Breznakibacter xylanolyticus]PZX17900.1 pectin methylesterase-like acyl-CoA thioesterase [Breznakibacter xylanolyticus]
MKKIILSAWGVLLGTTLAVGQLTEPPFYDFTNTVPEGIQMDYATGMSTDNPSTLSLNGGSYKLHGTTYGLNMKVDGNINLAVSGSSTVRFLGSKYSGLKMAGTATYQGDLGEQVTNVVTDLVDTYDFVYDGGAATLNFKTIAGTGNDLYLPRMTVIPAQLGGSISEPEKNIIYNFDLRDGSIIPTTTDGKSTIEQGLFKIEPGASNAYGYNGSTHGSVLKAGNKITLKVAGNSYIKLGGCQYSNGTVDVSSTTGAFDKTSQDTKTTMCFHEDGSMVDFLYVGTAGTVELLFSGTTYIPMIQILPVPYEVTLNPWVQKTGTITINGTQISYTAGADAAAKPVVSLSAGELMYDALPDMAGVIIDLGGAALSSFTPVFTGDIASVTVNGNQLEVTFTGESSLPNSCAITVSDSHAVEAQAGTSHNYPFNDGSVLPQVSYTSLRYHCFITADGLVSMKSNTTTNSLMFGFHDGTHGATMYSGNSIDFTVAGNATITFGVCQYGSATDAVFEFSDSDGAVLGSIPAKGSGSCSTSSFSYTGNAGVITATLKSVAYPNAEIYIHGVSVENAALILPSEGKTDVWDFGAQQLDEALYNNQLTEAIINAWYPASVTVGSTNLNFPSSVSAGVMSWVGGSNDRLRTSNTNLTRYDEELGGVGYVGRLYVNAGAAVGRYMSLTLSEDDEVTLMMKSDGGGKINFKYVADPEAQTDKVAITAELTELKFVAKNAGTYHIFDEVGKPSYYRVYRKDAVYKNLTGAVDVTAASDIPEGYAIAFTNAAGKTWKATMGSNSYSVSLPVGYSYEVTLTDANGYIISSSTSVEVTEASLAFDVTIKKVELFAVSGSIVGLEGNISQMTLVLTPDAAANKIYQPQPVINTADATYTVMLEPNCEYTLSASGVNDYYIPLDKLTITDATTTDISFALKPTHNVAVTSPGLTTEQLGKLSVSFTNLNEAGYSYHFASVSGIALRDGVYAVTCAGLDEYPLALALTSNLTVNSSDVSKELAFEPVTNWSFDDQTIANGTPAYKGMLFSGSAYNEVAKGHLVAGAGATVKVPVNVGEKIAITYYYAANFSIEGGEPITTASGSTSVFENTEYVYNGTDPGFVTLSVAGTTYFTHVKTSVVVPYQEVITVGADKQCQTINEALEMVRQMARTADQRVTIQIDPGNYEEMLVVDVPSVTLKNASATPDIALLNKGIDISANAVRITSYYGHGYSYYSMASNQKWNADVLRVNKENGYLSYVNKGSGTTNGSYWNATVVVSAAGFQAEDIIFENSFNQYISQKESQDVVVMWESGSKGARPTDMGNTDVQNKSFVERAAAIAFLSSADKAILNKCRVVGRQDSFYGGQNARVVVYKGAMMGGTDYLFGGMVATFYKTDLVMNTSDVSTDVCYITAAQQASGRGYLMYECNVTSAIPGTETASAYLSKPSYFGRPWQATTSEVVFFNTTVQTTDFTGFAGKSMIAPVAWLNSLGGESNKMYEFGTVEKSGENNTASRASWSTVLTQPTLTDGTAITTLNFTKGSDGWDPIPALVAADPSTSVVKPGAPSFIEVYAANGRIVVANVNAAATIHLYNIGGALIRSIQTDGDIDLDAPRGIYVVKVMAPDANKTVKVGLY